MRRCALAVSVSRWKRILNRIHLGKLTYAVVAVGTLLRNKPVRVELVREDGENRFLTEWFLLRL